MKREAGRAEEIPTQVGVALGLGWSATLEGRSRGAILRLQHPEQRALTVEISMTAQGPVIRAAAAALEIDALDDIVARCARFTVEARESLTLRSASIVQEATDTMRIEASSVEVDARSGGVVVHANDDVQLLGEQILLNCARDEQLPSWLPAASGHESLLPREDVVGDSSLLVTAGDDGAK